MARGVISYLPSAYAGTFDNPSQLQLLGDITYSSTEFAGQFRKRFITGQQMAVRDKHRSTTAGVRDDWAVIFCEGLEVLPGQLSRAFKVSRVSVQCSTADLFLRHRHPIAIHLEHARSSRIHPAKQTIGYTGLEERHRFVCCRSADACSWWSRFLLRARTLQQRQ